MSESPSGEHSQKRISRRDFLKLLGAGSLATTSLGRLAYGVLNPRNTPPEPLAHDVLQATATALERNDVQTSFVPEHGFTSEFFEKVRRSTFIIEAYDATQNVVQSISGWCVGTGKNYIDIVSARHLTKNRDYILKPTQISIWRPYIDKGIINPPQATTITTSIDDPVDLSITRCVLDTNSLPQVEPLGYIDDHRLNRNDRVLTVGYPREFYDPRSPLMAKTSGDILTIEDSEADGTWWAYSRGNAFMGESGEPVVLNNNDIPLVVGVLTSGNRKVARTGLTSVQEKEYVAGNGLKISSLIAQLN